MKFSAFGLHFVVDFVSERQLLLVSKKSTHICSVKAKLTIVSVSHGLYSTLVKIFGNINTQ